MNIMLSSKMVTNKPKAWQRDELILALDLYFKKGGKVNETDPDTLKLAEELTILNQLRDGPKASRRNANSVDMKVWNFHRFDPNYISSGRKALQHGNKLDEIIWKEFSSDRDNLLKAATAIKDHLTLSDAAPQEPLPQINESYSEASEGALLTRMHVYRERNSKLIRRKKELSLKAHGHLECEVCGFNYVKAYGFRGEGFMECHHIKPLNTYQAKDVTKLEDLALVCGNCHRMIHAKTPWLTLGELKDIISLNS